MNLRTLTAAAVLVIAASSVNAGNPGGLLDESFERVVEEPAVVPPPTSSESPWILLGVLALLGALAVGGSGGGS
jgi:hypothetical protein